MIIKNAKLITWEKPPQIIEDASIYISDGKIVETGSFSFLTAKFPTDEVLDAHGQYVMPGNICAHTHFYGAFSRGMGIPGDAPESFPSILQKLWWPLDKSLTLTDVRLSALVCIIDAIKHGTTTLIDHHASPNAIPGSLDEIAQAVGKAGLRASLCYEVTDRDGPQKAQQGIAENLRNIEWIKKQKPFNGRLAAHFGLHASLTLSEDTLRICREKSPENTGFHIHVAEHPVDEYDSISKSGVRVVDRLHRHGILGKNTIVAHGVHVDAKEVFILAETKTWVTHQPRSNMNNGVGMAAVDSMMRAGINVCLGNDGFSNAMFEEWKTAYLVHKLWHLDPRRVTGWDIIQMAVYNNASLASSVFDGKCIGSIIPGAEADLIFIDYHPFTPLTVDNLPWHIIFGFRDSMITTTIVAGQVLMKDRVLLTIDEGAVYSDAKKASPEVWHRYKSQF